MTKDYDDYNTITPEELDELRRSFRIKLPTLEELNQDPWRVLVDERQLREYAEYVNQYIKRGKK